jgi:hypothetical protein
MDKIVQAWIYFGPSAIFSSLNGGIFEITRITICYMEGCQRETLLRRIGQSHEGNNYKI